MYKLVIVHKGKIQRNIPLRHDSMIIGRRPESDILLTEPQVSSQHARLTIKNDAVTLTDLESTNGTLVNGSKVTEKRLQTGDQLTIGNYKLIFVTEHGQGNDPDATVIVSSQHAKSGPNPSPNSGPGKRPSRGLLVNLVIGSAIVAIVLLTALVMMTGSI